MTPRYVRNEPDQRDNVVAALVSGTVAVGVGVLTFYVARLFLARESIDTPSRKGREVVGD